MNRISRFALFILLIVSAAQARVISYAPYTDRAAIPAVQARTNPHFVLVEQTVSGSAPVPIGVLPSPHFNYPPSQVVVYASKGLEVPRAIFLQDGTSVHINR